MNNITNIDNEYSDSYFLNYLEKKQKEVFKKYKNIKHKVLVIPYIFKNHIPEFLIVKDAKFNEWTFISGCIEKDESYSKAASRELLEETKKIININIDNTSCSYFETTMIQNKIKYVYHVYILNLNISGYNSSKTIINRFRASKLSERKFNENTDIAFKSYSEIYKIDNVWSFIKTTILDNFFFEKMINEL